MSRRHRVIPWLAALSVISAQPALAGAPAYDPAPVDWAEYEKMWLDDFPKATPSEATRSTYSEEKARAFLDNASLKWVHRNRCGTCHTTVSYLMARPLIGHAGDQSAWNEVRASVSGFAAEQVTVRSPAAAFFAASTAAAMVLGDAALNRPLQPDSRALFNYLWSSQAADGGWDIPQKGALPFLERDKPYSALLVALALGYAPGNYYAEPEAKAGFARLQTYIRNNLPGDTHGKAVLLWASVRTPGLLSQSDQATYARAILDRQKSDGGWALASLGTWPRHDGAANDPRGSSDGYATSLAALSLCQLGYGADDARISRAVKWIRTHQRVSGRWYTRSLYSDKFQNYLSNMGTAYAVMALSACRRPDKTAQN